MFAKELNFFSKHSLVKSVNPRRKVVKVVIILLFQKAVNVTFMFNLEIEFEWKKVAQVAHAAYGCSAFHATERSSKMKSRVNFSF